MKTAIELARVVDRGIRESKAIDLKKLCIDPGKKVFMVFVDVYVLDHDGNLIDAAAMACPRGARRCEDACLQSGRPRIEVQGRDYPAANVELSSSHHLRRKLMVPLYLTRV